VNAIDALDRQALKRLAEGEDEVFDAISVGSAAHIDEAKLDQLIDQLVDYYREKRLCLQLRYFERQVKRRDLWDWLTWVVPFTFFFWSIAAAFAHFLYELWADNPHDPQEVDMVSSWLILAAACLPVIGAAIRILRTAHEFGRNTLRFRATSNDLKQLLDRLQKQSDPQAKLETLHKTERVLQAERREWLRLMIEAEWFG
jgi:hypothetical protein